jgi:hypothetical protein
MCASACVAVLLSVHCTLAVVRAFEVNGILYEGSESSIQVMRTYELCRSLCACVHVRLQCTACLQGLHLLQWLEPCLNNEAEQFKGTRCHSGCVVQ